MSYISVDVDIDDILAGMTGRELQQLANDLYDDGYIATKDADEKSTDDEWNDQIHKLFNNKWRLSKEDEETILNITKKII